MTDTAALLRLMSWFSPVFPTGGFAYSAGLEQAATDGLVADQHALQDWLAIMLTDGPLWNDALLLCAAARGQDVTDLCLALCASAERRQEMLDQGAAFHDACSPWFDGRAMPPRETPLPVLVGKVVAIDNLNIETALSAYLHAFISNQLQCAIRLSITGQKGAAAILQALEPVIAETAQKATKATLEDLGTSSFMADIAAMNHQTLQPRLFLS